MIKYIISYSVPASKYIEIEMQVEHIASEKTIFHLPAWRPGRYEIGNFAKNIQKWNAYDEKGNELKFKKLTKDSWEVETKGVSKVAVRYNYYASQLDAGGCWLDFEQLYVNPIHCFLYVDELKKEKCEVELKIPSDWKTACSLKKKSEHAFIAVDYDELVDSPFIASANLKHHSYEVNEITFHIWIQGECIPDWQRIEKDFKDFTAEQLKMMGDFPAADYHFFVQVLPYSFYHGVEHSNCTVLAVGPGYSLMNEKVYPEFIGVASHELFHVWNVKAIRPAAMLPYDYNKENYSRLGYVYEGFTTYYGDLFLARSGFFTIKTYLKEISSQLQKHMDNYGRFNHSVAQSSFDTWLDGYVPGVPGRKTSIYTEGSIIALMLDFMIRKSSKNNKSLDDVMLALYNDFAKKEIGYREEDIKRIAESVAGRSFDQFFNDYVNRATSYENLLEEVVAFAGLEINRTPSKKSYESLFGFKIDTGSGITKVLQVAPESPTSLAGLSKDDEVVSVNGLKVENNLDDLLNYFKGEEITLLVFTSKQLREIKLKHVNKTYYGTYEIKLKEKRNEGEKEFFNKWSGL